MTRGLELTGQRYGRLLVGALVRRRNPNGEARRYWECKCDCGGSAVVAREGLRSGDTKSCGCLLAETLAANTKGTHGQSGMGRGSAYYTWTSMRGRCRNPNFKDYAIYGGRGIVVCERWNDFANFFADMGARPSPKHTLDRIDSNGNYEPVNCRWSLPREQARNRRGIIMVEFGNRRVAVMDLVERAVKDARVGDEPLLDFLSRHKIRLGLGRIKQPQASPFHGPPVYRDSGAPVGSRRER